MSIRPAQAVYDVQQLEDELAYREDKRDLDLVNKITRDSLKGKSRYRFTVERVQSADVHYFNFIDSDSEFLCLQ